MRRRLAAIAVAGPAHSREMEHRSQHGVCPDLGLQIADDARHAPSHAHSGWAARRSIRSSSDDAAVFSTREIAGRTSPR
jgi:hypothetical protein